MSVECSKKVEHPRSVVRLAPHTCLLFLAACAPAVDNADEDWAAAPGNQQQPTDTSSQEAVASAEGQSETGATAPRTPPPAQGANQSLDDGIILIDEPESPEGEMGQPEHVVTATVTQECATTEVVSTDVVGVQPADIIFAIDTSPSMVEEIGFVQTYMNDFSQQITDSGIDARVILISTPGSDSGDLLTDLLNSLGLVLGVCIAAPLGSGTCPEDSQQPQYQHVTRGVGSHDALNVMINSYPMWRDLLRPQATKSIVVVSDDNAVQSPNNSAASFAANLQALDPDMWAEWSFNGIFCGELCPPAASVGSVYQDLVTQTGGIHGELCDQDFQPVFDRLAEQIIAASGAEIACEWDFPKPPDGQSFAVDLVEVKHTDASGTVDLSRVAQQGECSIGGWYYDNPLTPNKIIACPETCTAIQDRPDGRINVAFGCEVIDGCAVSSATDITTDEGARSCDLALPTPPEGVDLDLASINVRYLTPAGFGVVLGVVPDAAQCEMVEGGWYYDDPEQPTSIILCPQSCTEYQAGNMHQLQALFGCATTPARPGTVR